MTPTEGTPTETPTATATATPTPTPAEYTLVTKRVSAEEVYGETLSTGFENDTLLSRLLERDGSLFVSHPDDAVFVPGDHRFLKVGDRFYANVTTRAVHTHYHLNLTRVDSIPENASPLAAADLPADARKVVETADESGAYYSVRKGPRNRYYTPADYERARFGAAVSDHAYLRFDGAAYRVAAELHMIGTGYMIRRVAPENVTDPVIGFPDLPAPSRRAFRTGIESGRLTVYRGEFGRFDERIQFVRYDGTYYEVREQLHIEAGPSPLKVWASGDRVDPATVYEALSVTRARALDAPTRTAIRRAVGRGNHTVSDPATVAAIEELLSDDRYVRVDGEFYRVYLVQYPDE